jgi:ABC-type nitrate/sulfonate/bicarbonate transport system permease component
LWEVTARVKGSLFLPTPYATIRGLGKLASEGYLPTIAHSLRQLFVGYLLAVLVGVPVGLLMGSVRAADDFFAPYVNTLFIASKEALLPFLIVLFGTRFNFRVTVVFLFSIFFIIMNTAAGVRSVDPRLIETARAFRLPKWQIFAKVIVPGSLPYMIAGLRLGLSTAIKGMVIAEIWVTVDTGRLLKNFGTFLRLDLFFALSFVIIAIGVVSTRLLKVLENRLRPWTRATT